MADFQTVASATLDKLHEIENTVRDAKTYYQTLKDVVHQASSRFSSEYERILNEINVLQNRVETRHENLQNMKTFFNARFDGIEDGLKTADQKMESEFQDVLKRQFELILKLRDLRAQTDAKATDSVTAVNNMVQSLSATQDETDDVHDALVSEWETGTAQQQELGTSLQEQSESFVSMVETDTTESIRSASESISNQVSEKQSEFESYFSSLGDRFNETLDSTISSLDGNYRQQMENSLSGIQSFGASITAAIEQLQAVTETTMVTKEVMTTAVQSTNVGLESAIGALTEIKEIFEKIV